MVFIMVHVWARRTGVGMGKLWDNGGMGFSSADWHIVPMMILVVAGIVVAVASVVACVCNGGVARLLEQDRERGFFGFSRRRADDDGDAEDDLDDSTQALLAMLPTASAVVDAHDSVIRASSAAYTLGVVRDESICNDEILAAVHEVRRTGVRKQLDVTTQTAEQRIVSPQADTRGADAGLQNIRVIHGVSRPNWLKVTVGNINDRFIVVMLDDVSEAIRFAQVRESFIQNVSEQLIEPSHALEQLADSLEHDDLDRDEVRRDAVEVRTACRHMEHMVSDLLLLIKAQEPIVASGHNRMNVMEQLRDVVDSHHEMASTAGVSLELSGDESLTIHGEPDQFKAAVSKLVENAVGYSPQGAVVAISVKRSDDGNDAAVSVIDRGCGIAKTEQNRIFERFYRGSHQTERTRHGIGLGLAIVKHVALTHHGNVSVWSVPGQGSTFTMTIPLAAQSQSTAS